jgi:hypothetical protein
VFAALYTLVPATQSTREPPVRRRSHPSAWIAVAARACVASLVLLKAETRMTTRTGGDEAVRSGLRLVARCALLRFISGHFVFHRQRGEQLGCQESREINSGLSAWSSMPTFCGTHAPHGMRDGRHSGTQPLGLQHISMLGRYAFDLPESLARGKLRPQQARLLDGAWGVERRARVAFAWLGIVDGLAGRPAVRAEGDPNHGQQHMSGHATGREFQGGASPSRIGPRRRRESPRGPRPLSQKLIA